MMAAMRDASWASKPGRGTRYHVVVRGQVGACGTLINDDTFVEAHTVEPTRRCMRPGCRAYWPSIEQVRRLVVR